MLPIYLRGENEVDVKENKFATLLACGGGGGGAVAGSSSLMSSFSSFTPQRSVAAISSRGL